MLALAAIYVPSFLLIIGTLPFWHQLRRRAGFRRALAGTNAAVVGILVAAEFIVAAALAGGMLSSYAIAADRLIESGVYTYSRAVMYRIMNVYAIRMAGVFMISLGTIWLRTRTMPLWLALLTYGAALVLLVTISYMLWVTLVFPAWVGLISVALLVWNYRRRLDQDPEPVS